MRPSSEFSATSPVDDVAEISRHFFEVHRPAFFAITGDGLTLPSSKRGTTRKTPLSSTSSSSLRRQNPSKSSLGSTWQRLLLRVPPSGLYATVLHAHISSYSWQLLHLSWHPCKCFLPQEHGFCRIWYSTHSTRSVTHPSWSCIMSTIHRVQHLWLVWHSILLGMHYSFFSLHF